MDPLVKDAAALWMALAVYLSRGHLRWHRGHMIPVGMKQGRIATPYNASVRQAGADLHELGRALGFADRHTRDSYLNSRGLLLPAS